MTRRTRLEVSPLEDRVTPVLGAFDTPYAIDIDDPIAPGTNTTFSGVVAYGNGCTGFLLDRGAFVEGSRHVVTAAHCQPAVGDLVSFFRRLPDGNLDRVEIPVIDVWVHPAWNNGNPGDVGDVAVATLAAVAPYGVTDYAIYTSAQAAQATEIGQVYYMGGYGLTGTGFTGQSNTEEIQRMTISGNGGQFQIVVPRTGQPPLVTAPLPANPTATDVQNAFAGVGITTLVTQVNLGPQAPTATERSFEILFGPVTNWRRLSFQPYSPNPLVLNGNFGNVTFTTLVNGATDPEFQRIAVSASGGQFTLSYGPSVTSPIVYNPADRAGTAARIQAALEGLNATGVGPGEVTVRAVTGGPNDGTFEVSFDDIGFDIPLLTTDPSGLFGGAATVKVATIIDGGQRALRTGSNVNDAVVNGTLRSDYSPLRPDQSEGQGDSGSAGFIVLPDGSVAAISVVSFGTNAPNSGPRIFPFGSLSFNTRLSKYNADIQAEVSKPGYPLTLDMQYQFVGDDGVPDTITVTQDTKNGVPVIQLWVQPAGGDKKLYYQDAVSLIGSIRLIGTSDAETFVIDPSVTKAVTVDGGFGDDTLIGPGTTTAWLLTGANKGTGDTPGTDFSFQNVENLVGGAGADTFTFSAAGSLAGRIDGKGGADVLDFSGKAGTTVRFTNPGSVDGFAGTAAPVAGGFDNMNGFTGNPFSGNDTLVTPDVPGLFTHNGTGGVFTNLATGQTLTYANVDVLQAGSAADTFNVLSITAALTINGGAGDDTITVASDAPGAGADRGAFAGNLTVIGGDGADYFRLNGTPADEAVTARVSGPGTGDVLGATPSPLITLTFATLEQFFFDGRGGNNTFTALDLSNTSLGAPTDPGSGIVAGPTGPTGANARINGVTVGGTAMSAFTVNGDPDGSGDTDVLVVIGTSAPGLRSPFGEGVFGDGRDVITVTETAVSFQSVAGNTPLLPVQIGYTNGFQTFNTLYIAGGNEAGNEGDTINLSTSLTFNVVADGMLPSPSARPGDRVILSAAGGGDAQLVSDPSLGPTQNRVTARADGSSAGLIGFESGAPPAAGVGMIAVGTDAGTPSTIRVFDRLTGAFRYEVIPFESDYTAGVKVASGDVNGDGIADLVVGAGPGGGPRVAVFDGLTGNRIFDDFFAYEDTFRGGVTVAVGDVNQDGFGDLILGTGVGGAPRVRVLSGRDLSPLRDTFAYESSFRGGVSVAAGDVNGDGVPDLITSTGTGGGPRVVVLDGRTTAVLSSFFVFDQNLREGFFAAAGDVNGDGFADIIAGSGAGAAAQIRVFSGFNRAVITDFAVNDPFTPGAGTTITAGVRVAVADADGDGVGDVVTGLGPGGDGVVRTYKVTGVNPSTNALFPTLQEIRHQDAFDAGFGFGIFVGASD
ncbi:FG-GAP repeat protein [bacterium]|nr:FG-GAP repeat protein [bacterium]